MNPDVASNIRRWMDDPSLKAVSSSADHHPGVVVLRRSAELAGEGGLLERLLGWGSTSSVKLTLS